MKLWLLLFLLTLTVACGGYGSSSGMLPQTPAISMLSPDSATAGGEQFVLTVNGTGFAANSVVYWNSTTLATMFVSAQQLTATIPASDIVAAGSAAVFVKNPGTGRYANGVNSNTVTFTIH